MPDLRWFSVNRHVNPVLSEEMIQFLPRTSSAFQQANRKTLVHVALPGRDIIFGYKEDEDFEHSLRAS